MHADLSVYRFIGLSAQAGADLSVYRFIGLSAQAGADLSVYRFIGLSAQAGKNRPCHHAVSSKSSANLTHINTPGDLFSHASFQFFPRKIHGRTCKPSLCLSLTHSLSLSLSLGIHQKQRLIKNTAAGDISVFPPVACCHEVSDHQDVELLLESFGMQLEARLLIFGWVESDIDRDWTEVLLLGDDDDDDDDTHVCQVGRCLRLRTKHCGCVAQVPFLCEGGLGWGPLILLELA